MRCVFYHVSYLVWPGLTGEPIILWDRGRSGLVHEKAHSVWRQVTSQLADLVASAPVTSLALAAQLPVVVTSVVSFPSLITAQAAVSVDCSIGLPSVEYSSSSLLSSETTCSYIRTADNPMRLSSEDHEYKDLCVPRRTVTQEREKEYSELAQRPGV